jgi:RNA polymerase sigma-70 factor (sigma-E family)
VEYTGYVAARRPALLRFATVLTGRTWLAEDIVSDVLGRAYERWDHISQVAEPHAYIRRMIVNDYMSWHRRLARTTPRAEVNPSGYVEDATDEHAERDAMIRRLALLPRRQRAAVVLRYYAGLDDTAIAAELGCRETTVRSQISRALATLRIELSPTPVYSIAQETS